MDNEQVDEAVVETDESKEESREDRRAQHDFLRFKQEAKELREQNLKLQEQLKMKEESVLQEKQSYKELYERKSQEVDEYKGKLSEQQNTFFNSLKNQEIEKQALKLGIRSEALEDIRTLDQNSVLLETTSQGHVNVLGATEFVEDLKKKRPYWFKQQGAPMINTGNPSYSGEKEMSASDILKLQKTDPAKYREIMMKKIR